MLRATRPLALPALAALLLAGCGGAQPGPDGGWIPLFDGASLDGWHGYNRTDVPAGWQIDDGVVHFTPGTDGGDLVTDVAYRDFELELEWKVEPCGNSGVFYHGLEKEGQAIYATAPEYQLLDDACHSDARLPSHRAGSIYDLYAATPGAVRPGGEWNEARIVVRDGHVEHWLNGVRVAEAMKGSPAWDARVAVSKFRDGTDYPGYGTYDEGVIGLQDHGDEVWIRNARIRRF